MSESISVPKSQPVEVEKLDFGSLVFSTECLFVGVLDIDSVIDDVDACTDSSAEYVILNQNKLLGENLCSATIMRGNPSSVYFTIDKQAHKPMQYNIYFDSLVNCSSFNVAGTVLRFFVLILHPKSPQRTLNIIVAFRKEEQLKKCIRHLSYCTNEFFQTAQKSKRFKLSNREYIYSAIYVAVNSEIYEFNKRKSISPVCRENKVFKIRKNIPKILELTFCPSRNFEFCVERCFGFLYSISNHQNDEMKVFDDVRSFSFSNSQLDDDKKSGYTLQATILNESEIFKFINQLEDKTAFNISCSADFVVKGITSPVRFKVNYKVRVFSENHLFWLENYQKTWSNHVVCLKRDPNNSDFSSALVSITESDRIGQNIDDLHDEVTVLPSPNPTYVEDMDDYEIVLSGTFPFEPDFSDDIKAEWDKIFDQWVTTKETPMNLQRLLKHGIPCQYRKSAWCMLTGIYDELPFTESDYNSYVEQESQYEKVIQRDVTRTFTCHEFYKQKDGPGQKQLYRVCKAYSNYDKEIGYCQGMSFIIANLLLYMDELRSFCLLVQIMFRMGHREMFGQSFDELQCFIYIFKKLISIHIPELSQQLSNLGIEPQMFAPQWFLALFTSKFPLGMIDLCFDMYFCQGQRSLLQISIAMLMFCQQDLIGLNFENTLKYLSTNLPKKFCSPSVSKEMISLAYSLNFTPSSFEQLQLEFQSYKKELVRTLDPFELKKIENRMLIDCQMRLEQENGLLAHQLVETKIDCNERVTELERRNSILSKTVESLLEQIRDLTQSITAIKTNEITLQDEVEKLSNEKKQIEITKNSLLNEYKDKYEKSKKRCKDYKKKAVLYNELTKKINESCGTCKIFIPEDNDSIPEKRSLSDDDALAKIQCIEMELAIAKMKIAESESLNENLHHQISDLLKQKDKKWYM